ncbi:MAG TPA: ribosome silencing factor [bacterium]|nr:ribosome silencing factor [bacterium]
METIELARKIASEALDTKVRDLKLLDLRGLVSYTDYFILGTGTSDRHVRSVADRVHLKVKKELGRLPLSYEGQDSGNWVLLDYGDVVLHLFLEEQRRYYGLDEFWSHAPALTVDGARPAKKKPSQVKKPKPAKPAKPAKPTPKTKAKPKKKK